MNRKQLGEALLKIAKGKVKTAASKVLDQEEVGRLEEIRNEMIELLDEAWSFVKNTSERTHAERAWYGHIAGLLGVDAWANKHDESMDKTIEALKDQSSENSEEDEDDED